VECIHSINMNAITEIQNIINEHAYLKDLCKEQAGKINELTGKLIDSEIQRVAADMELDELKRAKPSLYVSTARTKTHALNKEIAAHLKELGEMTSDFYKTGAYDTAADIIATLDFEVQNGDSLRKINGIGKGIASKVDQFLSEYFDDAESIASNDAQIIGESESTTFTEDINNFSDEESESETDSESESDSEFITSYNYPIVDILESLASHEEDTHKKIAYQKAADRLNALPFKVASGKQVSEGPHKVKGIGKSIAKIIDEFLTTGRVKKLDKVGSTNEEIAWILEALASMEAEDHGSQDPFKIRAYRNAAEIIRELDFEVTSGEELAKGPNKVEGIGKGIAKKIDEFLQTGEIARLEELR